MKIGSMREDIYAHRRILQPIIRRSIATNDRITDWSSNNKAEFIEVQNLVDKNWYKDMTKEEINEVLFTIYSEMRSQGLVWIDIKADNVGRLLRPNKTNIPIFLDENRQKTEGTPPNEAIGFIGEAEGDVLPEGEYVVIDTDYIEKEEDYKAWIYNIGRKSRADKFEQMYQARLKQQSEGR